MQLAAGGVEFVAHEEGAWSPTTGRLGRTAGACGRSVWRVGDAVRALTAVVRNDQFFEGPLAGAMETGLVPACLRRIEAERA